MGEILDQTVASAAPERDGRARLIAAIRDVLQRTTCRANLDEEVCIQCERIAGLVLEAVEDELHLELGR